MHELELDSQMARLRKGGEVMMAKTLQGHPSTIDLGAGVIERVQWVQPWLKRMIMGGLLIARRCDMGSPLASAVSLTTRRFSARRAMAENLSKYGLGAARHSRRWSLSELDDHLFRDIGKTRLAAEIEAVLSTRLA
jgi:uncharacterized protein YjiS (DUF1127 family)